MKLKTLKEAGWGILGVTECIVGKTLEIAWNTTKCVCEIIRDNYRAEERRLALTCHRCGEWADPVRGTGRRYQCVKCGHLFAGDYHGLK